MTQNCGDMGCHKTPPIDENSFRGKATKRLNKSPARNCCTFWRPAMSQLKPIRALELRWCKSSLHFGCKAKQTHVPPNRHCLWFEIWQPGWHQRSVATQFSQTLWGCENYLNGSETINDLTLEYFNSDAIFRRNDFIDGVTYWRFRNDSFQDVRHWREATKFPPPCPALGKQLQLRNIFPVFLFETDEGKYQSLLKGPKVFYKQKA